MIKTAQELQDQAKAINLDFYPVRECSICGYMCGYVIEGDAVGYDCGCDCVPYQNVKPRLWKELAQTYNLNQPENNPNISQAYLDKLNSVWQFDLSKAVV